MKIDYIFHDVKVTWLWPKNPRRIICTPYWRVTTGRSSGGSMWSMWFFFSSPIPFPESCFDFSFEGEKWSEVRIQNTYLDSVWQVEQGWDQGPPTGIISGAKLGIPPYWPGSGKLALGSLLSFPLSFSRERRWSLETSDNLILKYESSYLHLCEFHYLSDIWLWRGRLRRKVLPSTYFLIGFSLYLWI